MDILKKSLEQREKPELIAIITHMLRQEPDLQWLLSTPFPGEETYRERPRKPALSSDGASCGGVR